MGNLTSYGHILPYAAKHKITIGAMNSYNLESVQAVVKAADDLNTPIIIQQHHFDFEYVSPRVFAQMTQAIVKEAKIDAAIALDHGNTIDNAILCIDSGFSAVMIDLSSEDYDKNVEQTKIVVEYAHARGVSVEAELGTIALGTDSPDKIAAGYTDPSVAQSFVNDTGVDCLAVSVGTAHGHYAQKPVINYPLLEELINIVPCPIVVHGGSGTPDEDILKIVRLGVAKLNIGTDLFQAFCDGTDSVMKGYDGNMSFMLCQKAGAAAREAVYKAAKHKIELLTAYRV